MRPVAFSDALVERLAAARNVAVLTGAGISAESGVPTFRDPGGLWERFRPEELASVDGFLANPTLVQAWYAHRREVIAQARPNAGHHALVDLGRLVTARGSEFVLATQNVDGLHGRAGSGGEDTGRLLELHGNLTRSYCIDCGREAGEETLASVVDGDPASCPACGGLLRPDVVWFGEMLPEAVLMEATRAAETAGVYLSVGTSAAVYPAAGLPLLAGACGAYVVEVNPAPSDIAGRVDEVIAAPAGVALPPLVARVRSRSS
jgi:NAD-dependent deacetylase